MHAFRHLLAQRHLAVLICVAALLLKLLVPVGYMVGNDHGRVAIMLCPGAGSTPMPMPMVTSGAGGGTIDHGKSQDHGKGELPCVFGGLSTAMLASIDPILLASLIAFVIKLGTPAVPPLTVADPSHLRPPMRGPPAHP